MRYRDDIDGLRAIAVLSVLAYHFGLPIPGGFTGVDVFFVISGFLITSNLYADISADRFSIIDFYDRRLRRIAPAFLFMVVVVLVAGYFFLMPGEYKSLSASAAAATFGVSNVYFFANTDYFDRAADLMPLLHTWSLAVEEQFYLIWPPVLFVIAKAGNRINISALLAALTIAGLGIGIVWFQIDPKAAFYIVLPRAWELLIGALLVFLPLLSRRAGEVAAVVGLALVVCGFVFAKPTNFPGAAALYPCIGAALLLWPRTSENFLTRLLGRLRPIGLISYSLYLWHWPTWVFARVYLNDSYPGPRETMMLIAVSFVLAYLSYRFVEQPFRRRRPPPIRTIQFTFACCAAVFAMSMFVSSKDGLPERVPDAAYKMRSLETMWEWPCTSTRVNEMLPALCTFGAPWTTGKRALLWGDSNAEHFAPLLQAVAADKGYSVALSGTCVAIINNSSVIYREPGQYNANCQTLNLAILELLQRDQSIDTVILSGSWNHFIYAMTGHSNEALFEKELTRLVQKLVQIGKRVVIIKTIPQWSVAPISCAILDIGLFRKHCSASVQNLTRAQQASQSAVTSAIFGRIKEQFSQIEIIDPAAALCRSDNCIVKLDDEFLYRDEVHFRRNLSENTNTDLAKMIMLKSAFP